MSFGCATAIFGCVSIFSIYPAVSWLVTHTFRFLYCRCLDCGTSQSLLVRSVPSPNFFKRKLTQRLRNYRAFANSFVKTRSFCCKGPPSPFQTLLISSVYQAVRKGDRETFAEKKPSRYCWIGNRL